MGGLLCLLRVAYGLVFFPCVFKCRFYNYSGMMRPRDQGTTAIEK